MRRSQQKWLGGSNPHVQKNRITLETSTERRTWFVENEAVSELDSKGSYSYRALSGEYNQYEEADTLLSEESVSAKL